MSKSRDSKGSAIIVVLLILSVMVIVSTNITVKYNSEFLRTANFVNGIQAKWYGVGSEELAARVLHQDFEDNHNTVNLSGYWASPERSFEVDGGTIRGYLQDDYACLNLNSLGNSLYTSRDENEMKINLVRDVLYRLMVYLQIPADNAEEVADSITDMIDTDSNTLPFGAEDQYYRGLPYPFLIPNAFISDVSEIRAVKGMSASIYRRISPYLCALNTNELKINVNTMTKFRSPLLAALFVDDNMTVEDALEIIEQREMNGWTSTSQFLNLDQVKGRITSKNKAFFNSILMVNSGYFSGVTKVEYNNTTVIYKSFYKRKNRYVELYKREYGGLE